ncbi:carbamoyl-phosphate synthase, large subunit [Gleimia coleocanis DSM 15436]|uniref:Carbamoyl phosphate synthase large chain n=1 Tax=Gleimia coleocanis DSM 15436 TaxID=525245 RepID=C0W1L3_9ACTO|nr:carbamoyl-phosphate synthase large subunit [Gleimia coleocanis]EEH63379.1 carbamoyl-phosphate synthase, large subunit [Gleimia coleocanis DSM 15436]
MPLRTDIKSVLVIGSGPIVIGQACEFDYSGTQACRILKSEGIRVILINSNPATIMTDPGVADATYVEPINVETIRAIIEKERPDALLPTLGGQTALNTAMKLVEAGVLEEFGVEMIGADADVIRAGEDRDEFRKVVEACGAEVARSVIAHTMEECLAAADVLGYPMVVRPSFTMGGLGSGFAHNEEELRRFAGAGLQNSITSEVLLEESILGWKEIELEVVRDRTGRCIPICSIENVDPMGVHTGDSITIAPALTLTEEELDNLVKIGSDIVAGVGVNQAGCNLQFAIHPTNGRVVVIEMNPRVSRSSALASKATGYPIAKIATRLALGYNLDEIPNDLVAEKTAADSPLVDYIVVKVPRFAFEKFPASDSTLTTSMKSVGEAMSLGRNFAEALQKAQRSIDKKGVTFHWDGPVPSEAEVKALLEAAATPTEHRLIQVQQALRGGATVEEVFAATAIDPWFVDQIKQINDVANEVEEAGALSAEILRKAKRFGFSDRQIAALRNLSEEVVREIRRAFAIRPVYKAVDTCAGQYEASTPYFYSAYDEYSEVKPREREAVIILGSGPNRIGQGIEFDYSCVHATLALRENYDTIMINCNPETVSTDFDISDRLYFEPLTLEDVLEVYHAELQAGPIKGVLVQLGGQTPLSLAAQLEKAGVPIVGTSPDAIALAEDRELFGRVLENANLPSPAHATANSPAFALAAAQKVGYPVLARPSFVLGGRGMEIVYDEAGMRDYLNRLGEAFDNGPLLIDRFLDNAVEIDVDALFDGTDLFMGGIMEHIEEAGIHSGDSACVMPPMTLSARQIETIVKSTRAIAEGVGVQGLLNIQYALVSDVLYVIEANPRASRTVPFASKALGVSLARAAAKIQLGATIAQLRAAGELPEQDASYMDLDEPISVKAAVLPFNRFRDKQGMIVDTILGPEMRSTGEVMGKDLSFPAAFAKSQQGAYGGLPKSGTLFISIADADKRSVVFPASRMADLGFKILATEGTASVLVRHGIDVQIVHKESERVEGEPTILDLIQSGEVDMVVNTPQGQSSRHDGYKIRSAAMGVGKPVLTTLQAFSAAVQAIEVENRGSFQIRTLQEYDADRQVRRERHEMEG